MTIDEKVENLAARVHKAYCDNYELRHGKPYWTEGDYDKLDEETKEIDRITVRTVIKGITEDLEQRPRIISSAT